MARIKIRARALDMLGRQQMASIPNALHELFKNAYDAYAELAQIDYYRADSVLTLTDDGIGMTREEFESRWLTLGTESKLEAGNVIGLPYKDPRKTERKPLGEKGIGRLAIATVGPQVLIVSKADRGQSPCSAVVSMLNWSFFEAPGIDMDDLSIPLIELSAGQLPEASHLTKMLSELFANYELLFDRLPCTYQKKIKTELDHFELQLSKVVSLVHDWSESFHRGTIFVVTSVDSILNKDIDDIDENELPPPLLKNLRGFVNTMTNSDISKNFKVRFYDHRTDSSIKELIGENEFFNLADFLTADQNVEGEFDEYGQFTGKVSIYHQAPQEYVVPWDGARGKYSNCGPFKVKFAYLQGIKKESQAPEADWSALDARLAKFGGIYIFRDGIRVLPYGNSDNDYLNIERRRTKSARDWFFSYRRIFGAIELNSKANSGLLEKAGREGFRENIAYRQFCSMLENLFKRLAYDWFRGKAAEYGNFRERLEELQKKAEFLEKHQKSIRGKKEILTQQINIFFDNIDNSRPTEEINELRGFFQKRVANTANTLFGQGNALDLLELESVMDKQLAGLRTKFKINEPKNIPLSKAMQQDILKAKDIYNNLEEGLFKPFESEYKNHLTSIINENKLNISHGLRLRQTFQTRTQDEKRRAKLLASDAAKDMKQLQLEVNERARASINALNSTFDSIFAELARNDFSLTDESDVERIRHKLDAEIVGIADIEIGSLERIKNQIQSVLESIQEGFSFVEVTARFQERFEESEERLETYIELAHLGTAIGIIQHEFGAAVNGMRRSIQTLHQTASKEIHDDVDFLRNNFEHLDAYLAMFTPLNRKLYKRQINLSGKEIRTYIIQMFGERLKRHQIKWQSSNAFEGHSVKTYPSTFLPPVINVVDNAIFWLGRDATGRKLEYTGPRLLEFDADERGFLIGNNGPVISERDAERIFEMSFSTKARGRGMGLSLAKNALLKEGYNIFLDQCGNAGPPVFLITTTRVDD